MSFRTMNFDAPSAKNDKPVEQARHGEASPVSAKEIDALNVVEPSLGSFDDAEEGDTYLEQCPIDDTKFESVRVVEQFVVAFLTLISDFGASISVQQSCRRGIEQFLLVEDELVYWARAKNLVCFFKALYLENPLPDVTGYSFGGQWKKWAKSRLHWNRRNTSLWASTFKLKNAACRLSERAAVATMHKHRASIGKTMEPNKVIIEGAVRTIMPLLERAAAFLAADYDSGAWMDPVAASNSACFEQSRGDFGQIGHFMERVFGKDSPMVVPGVNFCGFGPQVNILGGLAAYGVDDLQKWRESQHAYDYESYERRLDHAEREETPQVKSMDFYEEITVDGVRYNNSWFETYHFPSAEQLWMNEIYIDALQACDRDEALAKVACVLEPFKVRIITKGEAALQYMSSFWQQSAFRFNKTVPCFRLVGKAPSTLDLIDLEQLSRDMPARKWASSDFSGASDGTVGYLRDCIMDVLVMHLPLAAQSIIRACNGDHYVTYPGPLLFPSMDELGVVPPVHQTLGTLMGEKTSFPILCYEVLVAHISNRRRCGDQRPLDALLKELLVNGDDRLCVSNEGTEAEFWTFCETYLGFKESKGKSYLHTKYANINSQSYICDLNVNDPTPWKVPVRASGLENGQKKLDEPFDPSAVITQILDGCFDSTMEWTVLQRFMRRFDRDLVRVTAGRNLFMHQSLGGLGNRLPLRHGAKPCQTASGRCHHRFGCDWKTEVSDEQQLVGSALLGEPGCFLAEYGPTIMLESELPQLLETPWDVFGKPTYWNQEEFELKEMCHKYQVVLRDFEKERHVTLRLHSKKSLLLGRRRISKSSGVKQLIDQIVKTQYWKCPCCAEEVRASQPRCPICETGQVYQHTFLDHTDRVMYYNKEETVTRWTESFPTFSNVGLGRGRMARQGYSLDSQDEFDTALYNHIIESARFDHFGAPTPRFQGRAVDLWGSDPSWQPLRAASLRMVF